MKIQRPCEIKFHITAEADRRVRALAKKHRMPIASVVRGMMNHGFRSWIEHMNEKAG